MMKGMGKVPAKIGKFFYDVGFPEQQEHVSLMQRLTVCLGIAEKRSDCRLWHRAVRPHRVSGVMPAESTPRHMLLAKLPSSQVLSETLPWLAMQVCQQLQGVGEAGDQILKQQQQQQQHCVQSWYQGTQSQQPPTTSYRKWLTSTRCEAPGGNHPGVQRVGQVGPVVRHQQDDRSSRRQQCQEPSHVPGGCPTWSGWQLRGA
jgi:hypothetical protein